MPPIHTPDHFAKEGKTAYLRGEFVEAVQAFEAAQHAYASAGAPLDAAEMANNCSVAYLQAGEAEKALLAVEGTPETFQQAGDQRRYGMALANRGAALEALERNDEALEVYQLSAQVLQQAGEDQLRAQVMQSVSMLQYNLGRQLQALASMRSGLNGVSRPSPKQKMLKNLLNIPMEMITKNKPR